MDVIVANVQQNLFWKLTKFSRLRQQPGSKKTVLAAAAGIPGAGRPVVEFSSDGRKHTQGPDARHYDREHKRCGFHLFFNAFWLISNFCLFQMYMRDSLHQIDHGIVIHVLRGILRLFYGNNNK